MELKTSNYMKISIFYHKDTKFVPSLEIKLFYAKNQIFFSLNNR